MIKIWQIKELYTDVPRIGDEVVVDRPRDASWLPALRLRTAVGPQERELQERIGHEMEFVPEYQAWYEFEGGIILKTILSEFYDAAYREKKPLHFLAWEDSLALAELVKLNEYTAVFKVKYAAPVELIGYFDKFLREKNGHRFVTENELKTSFIRAASDWFWDRYTSFGINRGGHNLRVVFTGENQDIDQLLDQAEDLYQRLPSGAGFDNNWHLKFMEKHVEATTSYSPMNGETGMYEDDIELRYDLRFYSVGWQVQDLNAGLDDEDGHYDYCATAMEESLNA